MEDTLLILSDGPRCFGAMLCSTNGYLLLYVRKYFNQTAQLSITVEHTVQHLGGKQITGYKLTFDTLYQFHYIGICIPKSQGIRQTPFRGKSFLYLISFKNSFVNVHFLAVCTRQCFLYHTPKCIRSIHSIKQKHKYQCYEYKISVIFAITLLYCNWRLGPSKNNYTPYFSPFATCLLCEQVLFATHSFILLSVKCIWVVPP